MKSSQVRYPLTNTVLATAYIREFGPSIVPEDDKTDMSMLMSKFSLARADGIRFAVDFFTARFPRGKGVTKQPMQAAFYAACRTIKIEQSTPSRFKPSATKYKLSPTAQKVLRTFTGADHIITRAKGEITSGAHRVYDTLIEQGIINGYFTVSERSGSLVLSEAWLTDYGIRVRETMIASQDRADQIARRQSWMSGAPPMPMRVLNYHLDRAQTLQKEIDTQRERNIHPQWIANTEAERDFHVAACEALRDFAGA